MAQRVGDWNAKGGKRRHEREQAPERQQANDR
jgi:hypothetical protein